MEEPVHYLILLLELNMIKQQWKKYATLEISTPGLSKIVSWGKRRYDAKD